MSDLVIEAFFFSPAGSPPLDVRVSESEDGKHWLSSAPIHLEPESMVQVRLEPGARHRRFDPPLPEGVYFTLRTRRA